MLELAFLNKPAHTLERIAAQEISRFLRSSSSQSARSLAKSWWSLRRWAICH